MLTNLARGLVLQEIERASAALDAEASALCTCALCFFELGFDVVAIFPALVGENSTGILPRGDNAIGRQLGAAVLIYLSFDQQVAGFPRSAVLSAKVVVLDDARNPPGVARGVPFRWLMRYLL